MIRKQIFECFENLGFVVDEADNFLIQEYIEDSVAFVTLIVELETCFDIEIPDHYLLMENLSTLNAIENMVKELKEEINNF